MTGPNCMDENDCGNFFDQIDDLIEFPPDNEYGDGNLIDSGDCKDIARIWNDPLPESDPLFFNSQSNAITDLSAELCVPVRISIWYISVMNFPKQVNSCQRLLQKLCDIICNR